MTLIPYRLKVRACWGKWIVDCPRCLDNAEYAPAQVFFCSECGARAEVEWPDPGMRAGIERLLLMRPNVKNQSWRPGETLIGLMVENAAHGLFTELPEAHSSLIVEPERIRVDTLPATFRRELKAIA